MKNDLKNQKGITLIVLVVTIIVMIIIAAISINYGLDSVDTAQDNVIEANLQMVQQKIVEEYIKNDFNGDKKDFLGQELSYTDVQDIKGTETIALQKANNRTEYESGIPYYKLTAEILRNMGVNVPDGQEYLVDYEKGEIWDITNVKYQDGETYAYLNGVDNVLGTDPEKNVDSPITISLAEELSYVNNSFVLKIKVRDEVTKIDGNSWGVEDIPERTEIRNGNGVLVDHDDIEEFSREEITDSSNTNGEYIYTIKFPKTAFPARETSQQLTITIKRDTIIDNNGDTNSLTILKTAYISDIEESTIEWSLGNPKYGTKNDINSNGFYDSTTGDFWGTEATVDLTLQSDSGLKHMPYIFEYYWSEDGSAPANFDAVASDILLYPNEFDSNYPEQRTRIVKGSIYLNSGSGKGKLYVKPKDRYTGINTPSIDMGYKTVNVNLDNTPPTTEEIKVADLDFWGLYNPDYFAANFGTIILTDSVYKLRIKDNESGIRNVKTRNEGGVTKYNGVWSMDGVNKVDLESDILKNDERLLEFFEEDFRYSGSLYSGQVLNEQLSHHKNYVDISGCFLYGDRASDYYYLYRLNANELGSDGYGNSYEQVLSDNVGNLMEMPIKQGPFNIDGNQPDIDTVYPDQNEMVGKIRMIDDYSGVASGKVEDAQRNIDNLKNLKYKWVPEGDSMLNSNMETIVRAYRGDTDLQNRELTVVNTDADHISYSQENDFENYKYVTVTVDPPTVPGKYYLFVYAADFKDVAGNILLDYYTVSDTGGIASGSYTSEGANDGDDAGMFSTEPLVVEADATDIVVEVEEQNSIGFPTNFDIKVKSQSKKRFGIKSVKVLRDVNTGDAIETYEESQQINIEVPAGQTDPYRISWQSTVNGPIRVEVTDRNGIVHYGTAVLKNVQSTILRLNVTAGVEYYIPSGMQDKYADNNEIRYVEFGNQKEYENCEKYYKFTAQRTGEILFKVSGGNAIVGYNLEGSNDDYHRIMVNQYKDLDPGEVSVKNFQEAVVAIERFGIHKGSYSWWSRNFQSLFYGCINLTELPDFSTMSESEKEINKSAFKDMTSVKRAFSNTGISYVDPDVFKYAKKVTDYSYVFSECSNLTSIDVKLFENSVSAQDFSYAFSNTSLESIPENLFVKNVRAEVFSGIFYKTEVTTIPEKLFIKNTNAKKFDAAFSNTKIEKVPHNLFYTNTKAWSFNNLFSMSNLDEIPEDLFSKNTEANYFSYTFSSTKITSIPEKLFFNNQKVVDFTYIFSKCSELINTEDNQNIPYNLFYNNPDVGGSNVHGFKGLFWQDRGIEWISPQFFYGQKNKGKDIEFSNAFCETSLKEIPNELFWYLKPTSMDSCFESTAITYVTSEMFKNTEPTISYVPDMFKNCHNLKKVDGDLFKNCSAIKYAYNLFRGDENLEEVTGRLFLGCTNLQDVGAMFAGCANLKNVNTRIFEYANGKYCPIEVLAITYTEINNGPEYPQYPRVCRPVGIFMDCKKLVTCPDIWNRTKYPKIILEPYEECYDFYYEQYKLIKNYMAFYNANPAIISRITDTNLRYNWAERDVRFYYSR